jgi:uncharacterized protein YbjQ (UPF0145 family)
MAKDIITTTTDSIPGKSNVVTHANAIWVWGYNDPGAAIEELRNIARKYNYDAIVGLRLVPHPDEWFGVAPGPGGAKPAILKWAAYGTIIAW